MQVRLKVTPKAAAVRIPGVAAWTDGTVALKVAVTAAPEDGRANTAVIALLAKTWGLPKSALAIVAGARDRHKVVEIAAPSPAESAALAARLDAWARREGLVAGGEGEVPAR